MSTRRGNKGTGCLFRPKGRKVWYFKIKDETGKRKCISTGATDKGQAEGFRRGMLAEMARGVSIEITRVTFAELAIDLVRSYENKGRKTTNGLIDRLDTFILPFYGIRKVKDIVPAVHDAFVTERKQAGASTGEINAELSHVRATLYLGWKNKNSWTGPI